MNAYSGGQDAALALMAQDDPAPDPEAIRRREERDELMRIACQSALDRAKHVDPALLDQAYLAWARDFVAAHPPLGRPLGTGGAKVKTYPNHGMTPERWAEWLGVHVVRTPAQEIVHRYALHRRIEQERDAWAQAMLDAMAKEAAA